MARIANDNPTDERSADDNIIQPFQLMESGLRGRLIRLGSVAEDILSAHNYPEPVSHILAEAMSLGLVLASMLKYDGIFTLQTNTDGPVQTIVVDINSEGVLRAYASFDKDAIDDILSNTEDKEQKQEQEQNHYGGVEYAALLGKGYLAFTVDQVTDTERYQGIVAVEGESLSQSVQHYFDQSEQIQTCVRVAAGKIENEWRCGALMLQKLPEENADIAPNVVSLDDETEKTQMQKDEDWNRSTILLQTCTTDEFLAPDLHSNDLLMRLFHEEGITVYSPMHISKGCRCSRERVENVLLSLSPEERVECLKDGKVEMTCEFCSQTYTFSEEEIYSLNERES